MASVADRPKHPLEKILHCVRSNIASMHVLKKMIYTVPKPRENQAAILEPVRAKKLHKVNLFVQSVGIMLN